MVSNPSGPGELIAALGRERLLLGFAGAGGTLDQGVVRYAMAPRLFSRPRSANSTAASRHDCDASPAAFRDAGLPTRLESHIDAWLKTHEAWVSPFANAIYAAGGSNYTLGRSPDALRLLVRAIREGFLVLDQLDVPVTPARFRVLRAVLERLLVAILQGVVGTPAIEVLAARHANAARDEMSTLAAEFAALADRAGVPTPRDERAPPAGSPLRRRPVRTIRTRRRRRRTPLGHVGRPRRRPRGARARCCLPPPPAPLPRREQLPSSSPSEEPRSSWRRWQDHRRRRARSCGPSRSPGARRATADRGVPRSPWPSTTIASSSSVRPLRPRT